MKDRTFVALTRPRQVPIGSVFDTRRGRVRIVTATPASDVTQAGLFSGGFFQLRQDRPRRGLPEAWMLGGDFSRCPRRDAIRTLRANVEGEFRLTGRFAAATGRGVSSVRDHCDGTLVRVKRGTIVATELRTQRRVTLTAGVGQSGLRQHFVRKP